MRMRGFVLFPLRRYCEAWLTLVILQKVTISTCHSAKGLEWPVVFIPACEEGASRALPCWRGR